MPWYDYAQPGAYFVTICTHHHACFFGEVMGETVRPSAAGKIVQACWNALPAHFPGVVLDAFVVMPNHVHAIIGIVDGSGYSDDGAGSDDGGDSDRSDACVAPTTVRSGPPPRSLGAIVGSWKSAATRHIRQAGMPGFAWQRNYYERVLRDERERDLARRYIRDNPLRWHLDRRYVDSGA